MIKPILISTLVLASIFYNYIMQENKINELICVQEVLIDD